MDSKDTRLQMFSSEDSSSLTGASNANGELVKKDLSNHIEDNLSRLFECLKLEYGRRILVSPKWKNFGSQKLQLSEKTRLNNAIWRCWHIQYQKNKKPLFCQFVSPWSDEREPPKKPLTIILQGRYWRRKLDAIAREYKLWRTYYKDKSHEAEEEAKRERLRTLSTSSGDDEVSYGSPLTQVVNLMDMQLTTDMVQSHPDTLFTTKTSATQPVSKEALPEATISEIIFQPSLDSLQPNLDEFTKHIEGLVDLLGHSQPNESCQLQTGFNSSRVELPYGNSQQTPLNTSLPSQTPDITCFQGQQNNVEMMEQSNNYELYTLPSAVGQRTESIPQATPLSQGQDFMDTTDNFQHYPMDYDGQMEMQGFSPSSAQPLSHEGIPLEHLEEESEQELFTNQNQPETVVQDTALSSSTQKSPLPLLPQSPVQQIPGSQLHEQKQMTSNPIHHLPYRHSSGNLKEYGTSPVRKGQLPRNVSDNQLSMIDSSQLGLGLPFLPSQESKVPTQIQFPNLVAHLKSSNVSHSESTAMATQAKRPRIPRNMSDSGLYDMLRTSKAQLPNSFKASLSNLNTVATSPPLHSTQQTPWEQIQAQAAQSYSQPLSTSHLMNASQNKQSISRGRKGKLPRNMSDSSLMYMSNQQQYQNIPLNLTGFPKQSTDASGVLSPPVSLPSANPVLLSTLASNQAIASPISIPSAQPTLALTMPSYQAVAPLTGLQSVHPVLASTVPSNQTMDNLTSLQKTHPVFSSTLVSSQIYDARKQGTAASISTGQAAGSYGQMSLLGQLENVSTASSTSNTVSTMNNQTFAEPAQTTSLLSHLLQQGESTSATQKANTKEHENQMMKQLLQVAHKQSQSPSSKQIPSQELMLALKAASSNQQSSELMSLLQGASPPQRSSESIGSLNTTSTKAPQLYQILSQTQPEQSQQQQQKSQPFQQQKQQPQPQQQQQIQIAQQGKDKQHNQTQILEQQLQQQLLQQQHQLQQQVQENKKTSQLISALKSTTQVLQQQLAQPQQLQHLLQQQTITQQQSQGVVYPSKATQSAKESLCIQPIPQNPQSISHKVYPGTVLIAPHPRASSGNSQTVQANNQPSHLQPVPVVAADVQQSSTSSLISLQQMLEGNGNTIGLKDHGVSQITATNSSPFTFSQALFTTATATTATVTVNEPTTVTGALDVNTDTQNSFSFTSSPPPPKFTRPVSAADREQYKEHRRQSHITAEQKRRCNIKVGFDQLVNLVPSLAHQKNSKVSKATILQKSVEYTTKLQRERDKMVEEEEILRNEIQSLHSSINACQQQLPASGVPVNRQRSDQMTTLFNQYVKTRTQENYKFWILGIIFRQMFEVYNQTVSTNSWEDFCANILSWLDEQCTLPNLRPAVLSALRDISRSTSILTEPSKFPNEIQHYVATNDDPTVILDSSPSTTAKETTLGRNYFSNDGMR